LSSETELADAAHYVAAPGEVNDVVVAQIDERTIRVTDPGATITVGSGCTSIDAHTAQCVATRSSLGLAHVEAGDLDDRVRSFGNAPPTPDPPLIANGGPGDDELIGGELADELDGGGGIDMLVGGAGPDTMLDGDVAGAADSDSFAGGPDTDTVSYETRTAPLKVDLRESVPDGEVGERDTLIDIEAVVGGSAADRIVGDDFANDLYGGYGADRLTGGIGDDYLRGGPGPETYRCGFGRDIAFSDRRADFLAPDCETVAFDPTVPPPEFSYAVRAYPVSKSRRAVTFRIGCPSWFDPAKAGPCAGKLSLRETRSQTRLVGVGKISRRSTVKPVLVRLTKAGRRLARSSSGVLAVVTLKGPRLPGLAWTIRLRV
jgi:Ca2+-binding RTX toxin-like protein